MPTTATRSLVPLPPDAVPLCPVCADCIPLGGLDFEARPARPGEKCGAADHEETTGALPYRRTPETYLDWSTVEEWLVAWRQLETRRDRDCRTRKEAHLVALEADVLRTCESLEVLEEVLEVGRRWKRREGRHRNAYRPGPGGETPSALVRMRVHNQIARVRARVPDFSRLELELAIDREARRERVTVSPSTSEGVPSDSFLPVELSGSSATPSAGGDA